MAICMSYYRLAVVIFVIMCLTVSIFVLLRPSDRDIVPVNLRGIWVDAGAECSDTNAQLKITRNWINYDRLSFKVETADGNNYKFRLEGYSYATGDPVRQTVKFYINDDGSKLYIISSDIGKKGPFIRC